MISRRSIRVKVMQSLYSLSTLENNERNDIHQAGKLLSGKINQVFDVFSACVLYLVNVTSYAETDAQVRSSRLLKTTEDMNVNTSISGNTFIAKISKNPTFVERLRNNKIENRLIDKDWVKNIYNQLIKTNEYIEYIQKPVHLPAEEKAIIQFIWKNLIFENENVESFFQDEMPGWEDDKELIGILMENFFIKSGKLDFMKLLSYEKIDYANRLLETVIEKEPYCMELIEQKLNNWDKERIALIDQLLLRMGICELLYFETIPTKVTINEYIDIAKQYSTPLSGQFVNGVLDNILKDLSKENKINKQDRNKQA